MECIDLAKKCDGTKNCNDGSDEKNCQMTCNEMAEFQCIQENNTILPLECIPKVKRCNGVNDCNKGEDENDCPKSCNQDNQFTCSQVASPHFWNSLFHFMSKINLLFLVLFLIEY